MPEQQDIEKTNSGEIILYQNTEGKIEIDVRLEDETVWLTQDQMATLFGKGRSTVTEHIANVFKEGELEQNRTCRNFRQVRLEWLVPFWNIPLSMGQLKAKHRKQK